MRNGRSFIALLVVVFLAVSLAGTLSAPATGETQFILSPEDNHLWAYDAATGAAKLVVHGVNVNRDPGAATSDPARRDINGQVCVSPDGHHVITGEDTVEGSGSSHDPRIAGWGYFNLTGDTLATIAAAQVGKLAPAAGNGPTYTGDPDNFGCGWLDSNRLVTTAIGNTLPGEEANGQLFLWFGPFTNNFHSETVSSATFYVGDVDHCEIDHTLATAGGVAIAPNGDVYVASNRPDDNLHAGSIWRYSGTWPTTYSECTPEFIAANITKTAVVPFVPGALFDARAVTPSAVAFSGRSILGMPTMYVSSVFTGTVSEFTTDGVWVRDVWPTSPVGVGRGPTGDTPFGLAVTADGTLWIADLGIIGDGPAGGEGSVIKVAFDELGQPAPFGETIAEGLTYPDGLGVYSP